MIFLAMEYPHEAINLKKSQLTIYTYTYQENLAGEAFWALIERLVLYGTIWYIMVHIGKRAKMYYIYYVH